MEFCLLKYCINSVQGQLSCPVVYLFVEGLLIPHGPLSLKLMSGIDMICELLDDRYTRSPKIHNTIK